MPFSRSVKLAAYRRSLGRCECRRAKCGHSGRCSQALSAEEVRYRQVFPAAWGGLPEVVANCECLCESCYRCGTGAHPHGSGAGSRVRDSSRTRVGRDPLPVQVMHRRKAH